MRLKTHLISNSKRISEHTISFFKSIELGSLLLGLAIGMSGLAIFIKRCDEPKIYLSFIVFPSVILFCIAGTILDKERERKKRQ